MMTLAMAACGNNSSAPEQKESSSTETQQVSTPESSSFADELIDGSNVRIPNPFIECATLEEAAGLAGFTLTVPDTVEGYAYKQIFVIENEMLEVVYTNDERSSESEDLSGEETDYESKDFCVRKGTGSEDISGDYNDYSETGTISVGDLQVTTKGNDGKVNVALWKDGDYSFSIVTGKGLTNDTLQDIITKIK